MYGYNMLYTERKYLCAQSHLYVGSYKFYI